MCRRRSRAVVFSLNPGLLGSFIRLLLRSVTAVKACLGRFQRQLLLLCRASGELLPFCLSLALGLLLATLSFLLRLARFFLGSQPLLFSRAPGRLGLRLALRLLLRPDHRIRADLHRIGAHVTFRKIAELLLDERCDRGIGRLACHDQVLAFETRLAAAKS